MDANSRARGIIEPCEVASIGHYVCSNVISLINTVSYTKQTLIIGYSSSIYLSLWLMVCAVPKFSLLDFSS